MIWGLIVKTGVESGAVIEGFDVVEDGSASLGECGEAVMIDQLYLRLLKKLSIKALS